MSPRAVGRRIPYGALPDRVRDWVDHTLGSSVVETREQVGGMSPGCATRLRLADGRRAFVKAVGPELNPDTPALFRREVEVLEMLGPDPRWASLVGDLDGDDGWVALLLDDVEGRHPDLADEADMALLLAATDDLGGALAERFPAPRQPLPDSTLQWLPDRYREWIAALGRLEEIPSGTVDARWRAAAPAVAERLRAAVEIPPTQLIHFDVRDDNLLVRPDGTLVFLDWGAAGFGHAWQDPLLARLERVESPWFDESLSSSQALSALGGAAVTSWLAAFGCFLAWRDTVATDVNLPTLSAMRRRESARFLAAADRRVAAGLGP